MRVEQIGDATLYLADCREVLPTLSAIDAIVVDPPYGIDAAKGGGIGTSKRGEVRDYGPQEWDSAPLPPSAIDLFRAKSQWQIIFGGNYYNLPPTTCWLVWDKLNTGDFADCELAWTNLNKAVRRIQWMWNGMLRKGGEERGHHPTQKPVGVMEWAIGHLPADAQTICDPTMGSGTTGVACVKLGRRFIGIEQSERYFEVTCKRIADAYRQPRLFAEPPPRPEQMELTCA
jgi:site-specific DNA-methyltransferase (adenine-specific)/modification methylase